MTLKAMPGRCEDAFALSGDTYIPCNRPAVRMIGWRDIQGGLSEGPYRMCDMCADHSVRNRRAEDLGAYTAVNDGIVTPAEVRAQQSPAKGAAPAFLNKAVKEKPQVAPVDEDRLTALRAKVAEARDTEAEKKDLEERVSDLGRRLQALLHQELPDFFDELGIQDISLAPEGNHPGVTAKAGPYYKAAISQDWDEDKRADAFDCLKEEGAEDLIKVTVTCAFPREHHAEAQEFARNCRDAGMQVILKEEVHWGTLTSWLRDMVEKHNRIPPLDRIGGVIGRVVKLKPVKVK